MVKLINTERIVRGSVISLLLLVLLFWPLPTRALSCAMPDLKYQLENSKVSFIGRLVQIDNFNTTDRNVNKLIAIVEEPLKGVDKGQYLTIYQEHWLKAAESWEENDTEVKRGLFALEMINSSNIGLQLKTEQDVYYVGMCSAPYVEITEDVRSTIEEVYRTIKDTEYK